MMRPEPQGAVYLCMTPVDMRKQAATLALVVEQSLKCNIFEPGLYVFSNATRDRIKIVYWERNGLCLWTKRLEGRDRFIFPREISGETVAMCGVCGSVCPVCQARVSVSRSNSRASLVKDLDQPGLGHTMR